MIFYQILQILACTVAMALGVSRLRACSGSAHAADLALLRRWKEAQKRTSEF